MTGNAWTTPSDITAQVERHWNQGRLLADALSFPLPLRLRRPGPRDIGENFDAVRSWIKALEENARGVRGVGYDIGWEDINHRQVGRNRFPAALSIATRAEALAIIGKSSEAERYDALRKATIATLPELGAWLQRKPHYGGARQACPPLQPELIGPLVDTIIAAT